MLIYLGLRGLGNTFGCSKCENGYTRVQGRTGSMCVASTYISTKSFYTTTYYSANCKNYTMNWVGN